MWNCNQNNSKLDHFFKIKVENFNKWNAVRSCRFWLLVTTENCFRIRLFRNKNECKYIWNGNFQCVKYVFHRCLPSLVWNYSITIFINSLLDGWHPPKNDAVVGGQVWSGKMKIRKLMFCQIFELFSMLIGIVLCVKRPLYSSWMLNSNTEIFEFELPLLNWTEKNYFKFRLD
jgi:hypothetical protein